MDGLSIIDASVDIEFGKVSYVAIVHNHGGFVMATGVILAPIQ